MVSWTKADHSSLVQTVPAAELYVAGVITWSALSLLLYSPNNLIGGKSLFSLDTGLVFQMNKPNQAFRYFPIRVLTCTIGNHYYMRHSFFFLNCCSDCLSSSTQCRYRLSGMIIPGLKEWFESTFGASLQHKTPATVSAICIHLLCHPECDPVTTNIIPIFFFACFSPLSIATLYSLPLLMRPSWMI